jgi:hypothetical protein
VSAPLITPESSPGFITAAEAHKAAYDNGFRLEMGTHGGWTGYRSTTARGEIWIARDSVRNLWLLALTHAGVVAEFANPQVEAPGAPGKVCYAFSQLSILHHAVDRAYKLGVSLPNAPLEVFRKQTSDLGRTTEAERLTVVRIGQNIFRDALMEYWDGCCPLTGIKEPELLRASHIVPWAECESDELRLDVHNGLLLSALWDAAFDSGLISFTDKGEVLHSPRLSSAGAVALRIDSAPLISLAPAHCAHLARHRARHEITSSA